MHPFYLTIFNVFILFGAINVVNFFSDAYKVHIFCFIRKKKNKNEYLNGIQPHVLSLKTKYLKYLIYDYLSWNVK